MTSLATALASLPMYDAPREARAAFWRAVRDRLQTDGIEAPRDLAEPGDDLEAHWLSPDLLFSQTCGLPLSTSLRDHVVLLGTPHYAAPGCEGPLYRSLLVVRQDDPALTISALRGRRAAVNAFGSHSGASQLFGSLTPSDRAAGFFGETLVSGSHLASLDVVRSGRADVAAIDCVTFAIAARDKPQAVAGLRIVGRSPVAPGLPFIASKRFDPNVVARLRAALTGAIRDPALAEVRGALMMSGVSFLPAEAYDLCRRAALAFPQPTAVRIAG